MMNHVDVMGRITAAPILRSTAAGNKVTNIRIAVDRDTNRDETDFFDVVVWGKGAEFVCAYFDKGDMIAVSGRLATREYTDRDGNKRSVVEIKSDHVYFAGNTKKETRQAPPGAAYNEPPADTYGHSHGAEYGDPYGYEDDGDYPF